MARLEGKKPNVGAIIISAVIFALVAGGLFFAFAPIPEPTDASLTNSAAPVDDSSNSTASDSANATNSENSLTTILTPIPTATEAPTLATNSVSTPAPNEAPNGLSNAAPATPMANAATSNSATLPLSR